MKTEMPINFPGVPCRGIRLHHDIFCDKFLGGHRLSSVVIVIKLRVIEAHIVSKIFYFSSQLGLWLNNSTQVKLHHCWKDLPEILNACACVANIAQILFVPLLPYNWDVNVKSLVNCFVQSHGRLYMWSYTVNEDHNYFILFQLYFIWNTALVCIWM